MAWRIVECAGVGLGVGGLCAAILLPVLILQQRPIVQPIFILLGIGAVAGAVFACTRRPTLLQTALIADRQLGLSDLLSSALVSGTWADQRFTAAVRAEAHRICERTSPGEMIVRRLGGRAWGGIGLFSAILLTVALMSSRPQQSDAQRNDPSVGEAQAALTRDPAAPDERPDASPRSLTSASAMQSRQLTQPSRGDRTEADGSDDPARFSTPGQSASRARIAAAQAGNGQAAGQTDRSIVQPLELGKGSAEQDSEPTGASRDNQMTANTGSSAPQANPSDQPLSGIVDPQRKDARPAPWERADWPAARDAAGAAVDSGRVPDAYRDLVGEYFRR